MRPLLARSPVFHAGSPVMLDVGGVSADGSPHYRPLTKPQLSSLVEVFEDLDMSVVGVTNGSSDICELARGLGLPHVASSGVHFGNRDDAVLGAAPPAQHAQHVQHAAMPKVPPTPRASPAPAAAQPPPSKAVKKQGAAASKGDRAPQASAPVGSPPATKFIDTHVRSGQHVYAAGSLVVVGNVGSGAEVRTRMHSIRVHGPLLVFAISQGILRYFSDCSLTFFSLSHCQIVADGDIHVYGTLKGRAVAGLSGDRSAKVGHRALSSGCNNDDVLLTPTLIVAPTRVQIFVSNFDAELISIADVYMTCDTPESIPLQVSIRPCSLCFPPRFP